MEQCGWSARSTAYSRESVVSVFFLLQVLIAHLCLKYASLQWCNLFNMGLNDREWIVEQSHSSVRKLDLAKIPFCTLVAEKLCIPQYCFCRVLS
jgi:hypothetical protein